MKYVALLRGINVGGNRKVEMKILRQLFESLDFKNVTTYLNSGNVIFESNINQEELQKIIEKELKLKFGFEIKTLIKNEKEVRKIANAIPKEWKNDLEQKTDVAYLFSEIDSKKILDDLQVKKDFIEMKYIKGAIIWNVKRKNYNKSHLNKIISLKQYQLMTIRNVNTAKFIAKNEK